MPPVSRGTVGPTTHPAAAIRRAAQRYRKQLERGDAVGRITVPRLDLNAIVVEGTDSATLTRGPGRYTKSYVPGEGELIYIAGHRTTYGAPLAHIDRMRKGDEVTLACPMASSSTASPADVIVPANDVAATQVGGA